MTNPRNGPPSSLLPARSVAPHRPCLTGFGTSRSMPAWCPAQPPRSVSASRISSARTASCVALMRLSSWPARYSHRRSPTGRLPCAASKTEALRRHLPRPLRGRANLSRAADRPVWLSPTCRAMSTARTTLAASSARSGPDP